MDDVIHLLKRWDWSDERMEYEMSLRVANLLACSWHSDSGVRQGG